MGTAVWNHRLLLADKQGHPLIYGRALLRRLARREWPKAGLVNAVEVQRRRRFNCYAKTSVGKDLCLWVGESSCRSVSGRGQGVNVLASSVSGDPNLSTQSVRVPLFRLNGSSYRLPRPWTMCPRLRRSLTYTGFGLAGRILGSPDPPRRRLEGT